MSGNKMALVTQNRVIYAVLIIMPNIGFIKYRQIFRRKLIKITENVIPTLTTGLLLASKHDFN
jgi:hypothetical protein